MKELGGRTRRSLAVGRHNTHHTCMKTTITFLSLILVAGLSLSTQCRAADAPESKPKVSEDKKPKLIPPDNTVELPKELRESADKARKEGLKYFIWSDGKEPFRRDEQSNVLGVPLCYMSNGDPIPFGTTFSLLRVKDNQPVADGIRVNEVPTYSSKGKTSALHADFFRKYSGAGVAMISLNDTKTAKRISNEILVQIELR